MVSEALRRSFMDFHLSCMSHLPWIWVMETLARSSQVDVSLLLDLLEKTQELSDDLSRNTREFVSLRILENVVFKEASASPISSTSFSKINLNPSERCEDVLRKILLQTSASNLLSSGPDTLKWNLESFVVQKRASLTKFALQQLKVSILKGSHPVVASLKKHSGLPVGDPPEHEVSSDDGNCGVAPTHEGSDAHTQFGAANVLLNSPALPHENGLLHKNLPTEHLLPAKRNGSGTFKHAGGKFCDEEMTMENGCEASLKGAKKYKHDESTGIRHYSKGQSCLSEKKDCVGDSCNPEKIDYVGCMGKNELSTDIECAPPKGLVGHNDVLLGVPNDKAGEEQERCSINEVEGENKGILELKKANQDMYTEEQTNNLSVSNRGAPREDFDTFCDSGDSEGRTDHTIRRNALLSSQCTYSQDSFATTDWREVNLCVKCNKGEKLLACSYSSCPFVVHMHCLGSAMNSDTMKSFYCPSCAYSRAIKQYEEAKEKTSSALKDLRVFYCFGSRRASKKQSVTSNQMELDGGVEENNEVIHNFIEGRINFHSKKTVEDKLAEPSVLNSGDSLSSQGKPIESTNETLLAFDELNHGVKMMVQDYQSPQSRGQHHMDALVVYRPDENLSRQNPERSDSSHPSIHLSRRMRRPWTSAEEKTLKERVRKHCSPHDKNIPWKTILEFGVGIFQKGRTAMDLKDKWRNICKADPNS
ncbi:uncharacterized protein [Henckelia pumila]|uniref:uncharacterized protein isoform X2 n=1 Tax=Henckelia pumila TaxID=405737 RepID=UPI003C6DE7B4